MNIPRVEENIACCWNLGEGDSNWSLTRCTQC